MNKTARFEFVLEPELKEELVKSFGRGYLGDLARRLLIKELKKHNKKSMPKIITQTALEIYEEVQEQGTALERKKAQEAYNKAK